MDVPFILIISQGNNGKAYAQSLLTITQVMLESFHPAHPAHYTF